MTFKNNRAPLLSNIKLYASFHHHMWIQTRVTVRKRLSWVVTSVTLAFDLWPWPFAWTLRWSLVMIPENFMMIRWWEHSKKGVTADGQTDRQTDGQTENTICRAAWSQLKTTTETSIYVWVCLQYMYYIQVPKRPNYDDVIKWKHLPRYWPFVRGIHQSPVNSPHKGQWRGALIFFYLRLNTRLSKQS